MNHYLITVHVICTILITNSVGNRSEESLSDDDRLIEKSDRCYSKECTLEGNNILKNINSKVHYCDDFYEFACGNYMKNVIPSDKHVISNADLITDEIYRELKKLVEDIDDDDVPFRLLKTFYNSCREAKSNEMSNMDAFKKMLDKYGGLSLLPEWDPKNFNWTNLSYKIGSDGFDLDYFFKISVEVKNNSNYIIVIDEPTFEIPRDNFIRGMADGIVISYYKYLIDIVKYINPDAIDSDGRRGEIKEAILFERRLAMASSPQTYSADSYRPYNFMSISTLQAKYSDINWFEFLTNHFGSYVGIKANEQVLVKTPHYLTTLMKLFKQSKKRTITNYMLLKMISKSAPFLSKYTKQRKFLFLRLISGQITELPLYDECIEAVHKYFPLLTGIFYVQSRNSSVRIHNTKLLVSHLTSRFDHHIHLFNWMDEYTKYMAIDKINSIGLKAGYPAKYYDYKDLSIDKRRYFESVLNVSLHNRKINFGKLRNTIDKTTWINEDCLSIKTDFYKPFHNTLEIPYGVLHDDCFLQPNVFYNPNRPESLNYGAIGVAIAREMVHSIDNIGKSYDIYGNLNEWWSPETENNFESNASCFIEHYNNFYIEELHQRASGFRTKDENIADYIGIKVAYHAYKEYAKHSPKELRLPGLPFTHAQLFWISYANTHCTKYRLETFGEFVNINKYSSSKYRVNGPLQNLREFREDFHCNARTAMDPTLQCQIVNPEYNF